MQIEAPVRQPRPPRITIASGTEPGTGAVVVEPGSGTEIGADILAIGYTVNTSQADSAPISHDAVPEEDPGDESTVAEETEPGERGRWDLVVVTASQARQAENLGIDIIDLIEAQAGTGRAGEIGCYPLLGRAGGHASPGSVVIVGLGGESTRDYRRAGSALARASKGKHITTSIGETADDDQFAAFVEGLVLGGFGYRITGRPDAVDQCEVSLTGLGAGAGRIVEQARQRSLASWRARTYALTPSNRKGPPQIEAWASDTAAAAELDIEVWDDRRLEDEGFGGITAVGSGSAYPSRFVRLDYRPGSADDRQPHMVLVGKGITFDTGGISLKSRDAMMTMKRDMTGAGVVIAVMGALRALDVRARVTGLVASAENALGAASMRPGDVITHFGGRTTEIGNTDAEGRLVLADALAYAASRLDADAIVDIATLTGAGKIALGTSLAALFATSDELAVALSEAGELSGEPVWRLPLAEVYESSLTSQFADATNAPGSPGAITAALFLRHFVGARPWAHLDIASVGDSATDAFEYTQGATGFGARLLLRWLGSLG